MKIEINRNILYSKFLIEQFAALGVKYACVSPGSRNTPLNYAIAANKKIKSYVFVDERSSAFFALGMANKSDTPVLIVTTSGTAVAELYPAIIEAYKSGVSLIICTADRPSYLYGKGANQTINQYNIYSNHIRRYFDFSIKEINEKSFRDLRQITTSAFNTFKLNKGPVHFNIHFEKPFEPESYTDIIDGKLLNKIWQFNTSINAAHDRIKPKELNVIKKIAKDICKGVNGIILCGFGDYNKGFEKHLLALAQKTGFPIFADGATSLRFGQKDNKYLIENFTSLVRSEKFRKAFDPEIIIQFGAAPTSQVMLEFFAKSKAAKYLINEHGDWHDPSLTAKRTIKCLPGIFCLETVKLLGRFNPAYKLLQEIRKLNLSVSALKNEMIDGASFPFEGRIVNEIISSLPKECNLFVSNSLPIRDFDIFANKSDKKIRLFTNRGASGIDGNISTACGIAAQSNVPAYLVIGDLAFYYDLNALVNNNKYSFPLTIILINNNGGGIFEHLPISKQKEIFIEYFKTPLNVNFKKIITAFGCKYISVKNWNDLRKNITAANQNQKIKVLEIKTDSNKSLQIRKKFWNEAIIKTGKMINDNSIG